MKGLSEAQIPRLNDRDLFKQLYEEEFRSKLHTDLTIRCGKQEFHVHKIILVSQSEFFAKACDPERAWVEVGTGVITVDDQPTLVKAMLCWLYTSQVKGWKDVDELELAIGGYKDLPEGEQVVLYCALLYALADKYRIDGLKLHILDRVSDRLDKHMPDQAKLPKLLKAMYQAAPDSDGDLRKIGLRCTFQNRDRLMWNPLFKAEMDEVDGFWKDMMEYTVEHEHAVRYCSHCEELREGELFGDASIRCEKCRTSHSVECWNAFRRPHYPTFHKFSTKTLD